MGSPPVWNLTIPGLLKEEFATLEAIGHSSARTRGVDAFVLVWVKYEKQLRRLFCFLVFQQLEGSTDSKDEAISAIVANRNLDDRKFIKGINCLGPPLPEMLGDEYNRFQGEIERIRNHRNKIIHGQITGKNLTARQIERDVELLIKWVEILAKAADRHLGYDGLKKNTYRVARRVPRVAVAPLFRDATAFKRWLQDLVERR
jgi:hypothetical protein